jgi:filamentous hemagglutinin
MMRRLNMVELGQALRLHQNDHEKQESKPVDKLNQKQESAIKKIDNTIKNALKDHDITGTLKDMDGNPVPKESGGYWDHMQEMQIPSGA